MGHDLEIIIPVGNAAALPSTIASLTAQTDRNFAVALAGITSNGKNPIDAAQRQLAATGIIVRRLKPSFSMTHIEQLNWSHGQAEATWIKPLHPGEQLNREYVARLMECIAAKPNARIVACDWILDTEWGPESIKTPFDGSTVTVAEFKSSFLSHINWLSRTINFAYHRTAWLAMGGYSPQLPSYAALNLHVLLALHYGLENLGETLAGTDESAVKSLNETRRTRVNHSLELWMVLRQAAIYCRAAGKPLPAKSLLLWAIATALGRH